MNDPHHPSPLDMGGIHQKRRQRVAPNRMPAAATLHAHLNPRLNPSEQSVCVLTVNGRSARKRDSGLEMTVTKGGATQTSLLIMSRSKDDSRTSDNRTARMNCLPPRRLLRLALVTG